MIGAAVHSGSDAAADPQSVWLSFLASPAAPNQTMSILELEGYLTGVIVAPSLIRPGLWMAGLWPDEEPVFDDAVQIRSVLARHDAQHAQRENRAEPPPARGRAGL
jgi:yecA family protein